MPADAGAPFGDGGGVELAQGFVEPVLVAGGRRDRVGVAGGARVVRGDVGGGAPHLDGRDQGGCGLALVGQPRRRRPVAGVLADGVGEVDDVRCPAGQVGAPGGVVAQGVGDAVQPRQRPSAGGPRQAPGEDGGRVGRVVEGLGGDGVGQDLFGVGVVGGQE